MNTRKIAGMFGVIMISLMLAGVAYAHWEEYLVIDVNVEAGRMDIAESACVWFLDVNDKTVYDKYGDPIGEPYHVATATIEPIASKDGIVRHIKVYIDNAYPQLEGLILIDYHNVGTVPAKLVWKQVWSNDPYFADYIDLTPLGWYPDWGKKYGSDPAQLDPCHTGWLVYKFRLTNDVEEETTYTFYIDTDWYNWNEPPILEHVSVPYLSELPSNDGPYYYWNCFTPDRYGHIPVVIK